jgi:hypothetical protein
MRNLSRDEMRVAARAAGLPWTAAKELAKRVAANGGTWQRAAARSAEEADAVERELARRFLGIG